MTQLTHEPGTLFDMYKLHAELAEQAAALREGLNKLYSGLVTTIVAASVLLHRLAPNSETMWVLPMVGLIVSVAWVLSFRSVTGRLSAKNAVLLELERKLPFDFLRRENAEFNKLRFVRRKWSGLVMPVAFLVLCVAWFATLIVQSSNPVPGP